MGADTKELASTAEQAVAMVAASQSTLSFGFSQAEG